ncbi:sulfite exporter TauE/SafE family protein [Telmatospirillum sp. J64-1]|uniref:sulfite exporter TauE/SafE family protein n=1 Tax=Telmatospirillum sp. J64-1 TaxID=2502183 RepID=UPI00115D506A|nr:sulfite exporter TauE/SafE family protein [Telmatospirillum sp. J64-1]
MIALILCGAVGGFLLGLIGIGTAVLAVPVLILLLPQMGVDPGLAPKAAIGTSMAVVAISSLSSIYAHGRLGNIDWTMVRRGFLPSVIGVGVAAVVVGLVPGDFLRLLFAGFLTLTAVKILWPEKKEALALASYASPTAQRLGSLTMGFLGGLVGAGGAFFMIPFLVHRGVAMARAVASATTLGLPISIFGSAAFIAQGLSENVQAAGMIGHVHLMAALAFGLSSLAFAPLGAAYCNRLPRNLLKRLFGVVLLALAVRLVMG